VARGQYGARVGDEQAVARERAWWRRQPAWWRRSREEWERLSELEQQQWWQYQQQPYYQQPYYPGWRWVRGSDGNGYWEPEQRYPGWRWVHARGDRPGYWERER
jgi:hypothetical protein